jgi:hypothetical protein
MTCTFSRNARSGADTVSASNVQGGAKLSPREQATVRSAPNTVSGAAASCGSHVAYSQQCVVNEFTSAGFGDKSN